MDLRLEGTNGNVRISFNFDAEHKMGEIQLARSFDQPAHFGAAALGRVRPILNQPPHPPILNPTQLLGIGTFLTAAIIAWLASRRCSHPIWRFSTAIYLLLSLEISLGLRHQLQQLVRAAAKNRGLYETRQTYQPYLIGFILLLLALTCLIWISRRRWAAQPLPYWSAFSLIVVLSIFLVEIISLHSVDRILYHRLGGILLIGYLWLFACLPHLLSGLRQATIEAGGSER
jgi:hypothetical protein